MHGKFDSRHPLVGLSDELIRLNGRMKSLFAGARRPEGLGDSEQSVLNAVVEADHPPTVPQIGRSYGQPRQIVDVRKQREDYHAAVRFARSLSGVDPERIAIWGTSLSGGASPRSRC